MCSDRLYWCSSVYTNTPCSKRATAAGDLTNAVAVPSGADQLPALQPVTRSSAATVMGGSPAICIRYEGNSSARWDGKEVLIDREWLETLYPPSLLVEGKEVCLPYPQRDGKVDEWKGIIVKHSVKKMSKCSG